LECAAAAAAAAVEDLMTLVQACRNAPDLECRLRETLNMARDVEKWRNLMRMLTEKVRRACLHELCIVMPQNVIWGLGDL
jgi:hypothetical protein